jgi:4-amino-4-deoxy-L-arabinose transferase-like glycosyltransferase
VWAAASNRLRHVRWLLEPAVFAFCALLVWATATRSGLNHNEHMYVAAARLFGQLHLYSDYAFLQTPLLPMVNSALFAIAGNEHLLLVARIHAALWALAAVFAVYAIAWRMTRSRTVGAAAALAFGTHPLFLVNVMESSNYVMPLALTLLSFAALVLAADDAASARLRSLACGMCGLSIGLAVTCKSFYALLAPGLLAIAWIACGRIPALCWLAGAALGVAPVLYYLISDPEAFYYGNLGYHVANTDWRESVGSKLPMTLGKKLQFVRTLWHDPLWIGATLYCLGAVGVVRRRAIPIERRRMFVSISALVLLGFVAALLPTPAFDKYFVLPFAFLLLAAVAAIGMDAMWPRSSFIALCVLCAVTAPATAHFSRQLRERPTWARVEHEAHKLDDTLDCSESTYVATLSPILPLEAGCSIYPELATGPFAFRVADDSSHDSQEELNVVGRLRLESFLESKKPRAILVGFEPNHDTFFENFAEQRGYVRVQERFMQRGRLWIAPDQVH